MFDNNINNLRIFDHFDIKYEKKEKISPGVPQRP